MSILKPIRSQLTRRMVQRRIASVSISLLLAALWLFTALPASAHGYIVRSIPEDRAAFDRAPARLQYWFSEGLEPEFSSLTVRDAAGQVVAGGGVDPSNLTLLSARLPSTLPDGAYVAELRIAFASDGHVVAETRVFFVGAPVEGASGQESGYVAQALEVLWRVLVLSSALLLLGAFTIYAAVLVPTWGNSQYRAGLLPPRVMNSLNWIVGIALVVAFAGNILALLQQSMVFFGTDIGRVLGDQLFNVVRIGTRFGDTWNARMILLILVAGLFAASLYLRGSQPETVRPFWVANAWGMALVVGTFSVASHAAGSLLLPWLAIGSDWLHGLAVGIWAGGVAVLALVAPVALQPYTGEARRLALLAALRRFSRLAAAALVVVIATGIYSALNWVTTPADLATSYGGALILKLILVALLLAVGALHQIVVNPQRYARWSAFTGKYRSPRLLQSLVPSLRLEAVLVLAVLVAVGYLSATPIPKLVLEGQAAPPPSATQVVDGYTVTTTITPGGPGINTYDVAIQRGGTPVDGLEVYLRMSEPSRDLRAAWHRLESIGDGLYTSVGDDLSRPGEWWTVLQIDGTRAAFDWTISADAAVIDSRPPMLLNWLALAGVVGALVYAASPLLRRFYHALDLRPQAVTVALGATVAGIAVVVLGIQLTQQSTEQAELASNPLPQVVNIMLPDEASLARGQALYESACAAWLDANDQRELLRRLPRLRDEALYAAVSQDGWWSLPKCQGDSTPDQWWDVVNYLRSLEAVSG